MTKAEMKFQAQLEEYRQLRAEILNDFQTNNVIRTILVTIYAAIISCIAMVYISLKELPDPLLVLATVLFPLVIWVWQITRSYSIQRTGLYIEVALETELEGLNWETYVRLRNKPGYRLKRFGFPGLSFILIMISVVGSLVLWFMPNESIATGWAFWGAVFLVVILVILCFVFSDLQPRKREKLKPWIKKTAEDAKRAYM